MHVRITMLYNFDQSFTNYRINIELFMQRWFLILFQLLHEVLLRFKVDLDLNLLKNLEKLSVAIGSKSAKLNLGQRLAEITDKASDACSLLCKCTCVQYLTFFLLFVCCFIRQISHLCSCASKLFLFSIKL